MDFLNKLFGKKQSNKEDAQQPEGQEVIHQKPLESGNDLSESVLSTEDQRKRLLSPNEINHWHDTPNRKFRIGVKNIGELRMDVKGCNILIQTSSGIEWINFGNYKFMYIDWDNPFLLSKDSNFLVLHWTYFHVHATVTPVIINLNQKSFCLVEPQRDLWVKSIQSKKDFPIITCSETKWENSQRQELTKVEVPVSAPFKPINDFYSLDPMSIETNVYAWKDKVLTITFKRI